MPLPGRCGVLASRPSAGLALWTTLDTQNITSAGSRATAFSPSVGPPGHTLAPAGGDEGPLVDMGSMPGRTALAFDDDSNLTDAIAWPHNLVELSLVFRINDMSMPKTLFERTGLKVYLD